MSYGWYSVTANGIIFLGPDRSNVTFLIFLDYCTPVLYPMANREGSCNLRGEGASDVFQVSFSPEAAVPLVIACPFPVDVSSGSLEAVGPRGR